MNKIFLIIQREYLARVRKRSFIVMSILGPILFAAFLIVPTYLATMQDKEVKTIAVVDSSTIFLNNLPESDYIKFTYVPGTELESLKNNISNNGYSAILFIPGNILASNTSMLYSDKQPSMSTRMFISNALDKELEKEKLKAHHIENLDNIMKSVATRVNLRDITLTEEGGEKESHAGLAMGIGYVGGMLIYFFIFLFGAMVMRGVIEEKTSRIVEVIISSVRPFQLMMGKIIGVGLVGLTQFLLWVILTLGLVTGVQKAFFPKLTQTPTEKVLSQHSQDIMSSQDNSPQAVEPFQADEGNSPQILRDMYNSLGSVNFGLILGMFIFYFIGGFMLYGSLFAMVGSAVDSETDTQQFMLPITVPLIIGIFVMINAIENPAGPLAFWFSLIPLTSPIVMMVRIPFNPPAWEILTSAGILILTFLGTTWMAGKIYRTGILMYGKKVTYSELLKWLFYKN